MKNTSEYERLYELYKDKPFDELETIAKNEDGGYSDEAQKVAVNLLSGKNQEFLQYKRKREEEIRIKTKHENEKAEAREKSPLYEDVHQIAKDVRWFKNLVILFIVLDFIAFLIFFLIVIRK